MAASNLTRGGLWGAVAGLVAGLALAIFLGLTSLATGGSFWLMGQLAGYGIFGASILTGAAAGPLLLGFLIHFAVAALFGLTYGWAFWGQPKGLTLVAGLMWGFLAWAVMFYAVAPLVGAGNFVQSVPIGRALVAHALFGASLALAFLPYQERAARPGRILREPHGRRRRAVV